MALLNKGVFTIHIGPHKTGTTYIQKCLVNSRDELLDAGVFYPNIGQEFLFGHHNIVNSIIRKDDLPIDRLIESVPANVKRVLISSENFDNLSVKSLEHLASKLDGFDIRIVYFKRNAESLLYSNWQENIKHGGVASWAEYILDHFVYPYRSIIINPSLILDNYASVFGIESIRIIDYQEICHSGGDIAVALMKQVDADIDIGLSTKDINKSMPASTIEIIRALNQIFANEKKLNILNVRQAFLEVLKDTSAKIVYKELTKIVCRYNVPFTLNGSAVLKLMEKKFLGNYGGNMVTDYNTVWSDLVVELPASGWLSDEKGRELLSRLKQMVEKSLEF